RCRIARGDEILPRLRPQGALGARSLNIRLRLREHRARFLHALRGDIDLWSRRWRRSGHLWRWRRLWRLRFRSGRAARREDARDDHQFFRTFKHLRTLSRKRWSVNEIAPATFAPARVVRPKTDLYNLVLHEVCMRVIQKALTFDDVLLVPAHSTVL